VARKTLIGGGFNRSMQRFDEIGLPACSKPG